jgi:glycosyltransferase involved in cell wall biosynthesis
LENKVILFYDQYISGHHLEYINHLVDYSRRNSEQDVIFVIRQEAIDVLKKDTSESIRFVAAPSFSSDSLVEKSLKEGRWLVEIIQREKVRNLCFLAIDPYQFLLGIGWFRKLACDIHGILFSPPHRLYPSLESSIKERIKQSIRRNRKVLQLRWALKNKRLKTLFVLDDSDGVDQLNKRFRPVFQLLNDPIEQSTSAITTSYKRNVAEGEKLLLSFGAIHPRKNLINIVKSLQYCEHYSVTLLITGKGKTEYIARLHEAASIYDNDSKIKIIIDNKFVSQEEMDRLFAAADGIVMVYQNFYGSSGVLGRAAKVRKPVLVSDHGLVSSLTKKYDMGYSVKGDPASIAEGIKKIIIQGTPSNYKGEEYLNLKTTEHFSSELFNL